MIVKTVNNLLCLLKVFVLYLFGDADQDVKPETKKSNCKKKENHVSVQVQWAGKRNKGCPKDQFKTMHLRERMGRVTKICMCVLQEKHSCTVLYTLQKKKRNGRHCGTAGTVRGGKRGC